MYGISVLPHGQYRKTQVEYLSTKLATTSVKTKNNREAIKRSSLRQKLTGISQSGLGDSCSREHLCDFIDPTAFVEAINM